MTDNTPYYEIIDFAANDKPKEFVDRFNNIMLSKAYDAVEKYKQEIAGKYFGSEKPESEEDNKEESSDENA